MLLAVEMVIALLLGFVFGRMWEIRKRLMLSKTVDERSRPVEIRAATSSSEQALWEDSRLAALDRELKDLLKFAAVQGQRINKSDHGTLRAAPTPYTRQALGPGLRSGNQHD